MYTVEEIEFIIDEYIAEKKDYVVIKEVVAEISAALDCDIAKLIRGFGSKCKYFYNYKIYGYINDQEITRGNLIHLHRKIIRKIVKKLEKERESKLTQDEMEQVIDDILVFANAD
jgi:hypothetical protein